jgi:hypothetical protein
MEQHDLEAIRAIVADALDADRRRAEARFDARLDEAFERHLATISEEITDVRGDIAALDAKLDRVDGDLGARIDQLAHRLAGDENSETDKRHQIEVRVARLEQHAGLAGGA